MSSEKSYKTYHTIVIGLGAAGAVAASRLAKAKKSVLALEATKRWGGRVMSVSVPEGIVEAGAEWIYGTVNNIVYDDAATSRNLPLQFQDMEFEVYRAHGQDDDHRVLNELAGYCIDTQFLDTPRINKPYPEFMTKQILNYIKQHKTSNSLIENNDFIDNLLHFANASVCAHKGCNDWSELSAFTEYEDMDGPKHLSWHKLGFSTYFEIVLNKYQNGPGYQNLEILFKKEVVNIKWPIDPKAHVKVKCKDGTAYYCNHVIVTIPVGVLKEKHLTLFDPPLPVPKVNSIDTIGIGVIDKITLIFPYQWWVGEKDDQIAFFWDSKSRAKVGPADQWMLKIVKATVPLGVPNALTLWISGDSAKAMEFLPDDVVERKCMDILRWFLGFDMKVPEPNRVVRSAWYANPYTRGSDSYEYIHEFPHARQILAEPLVDVTGIPRVLFAGEATHPKYYSSVHGAAFSGLREAARLVPRKKSDILKDSYTIFLDYVKATAPALFE